MSFVPFPLFTMKHYLDELQETIERQAEELLSETLNDRLAADLAQNIADDVVQLERCGTTVRYLLIDFKTGQLESRVLYEAYEDAEKEAVERSKRDNDFCTVATLLCNA